MTSVHIVQLTHGAANRLDLLSSSRLLLVWNLREVNLLSLTFGGSPHLLFFKSQFSTSLPFSLCLLFLSLAKAFFLSAIILHVTYIWHVCATCSRRALAGPLAHSARRLLRTTYNGTGMQYTYVTCASIITFLKCDSIHTYNVIHT